MVLKLYDSAIYNPLSFLSLSYYSDISLHTLILRRLIDGPVDGLISSHQIRTDILDCGNVRFAIFFIHLLIYFLIERWVVSILLNVLKGGSRELNMI